MTTYVNQLGQPVRICECGDGTYGARTETSTGVFEPVAWKCQGFATLEDADAELHKFAVTLGWGWFPEGSDKLVKLVVAGDKDDVFSDGIMRGLAKLLLFKLKAKVETVNTPGDLYRIAGALLAVKQTLNSNEFDFVADTPNDNADKEEAT